MLWVGISFEQSASTEYFKKVRTMLASSGRLAAVSQVLVNPSDDVYFNLLSSCSNTGELRLLDVRRTSDELLPLLASHLGCARAAVPEAPQASREASQAPAEEADPDAMPRAVKAARQLPPPPPPAAASAPTTGNGGSGMMDAGGAEALPRERQAAPAAAPAAAPCVGEQEAKEEKAAAAARGADAAANIEARGGQGEEAAAAAGDDLSLKAEADAASAGAAGHVLLLGQPEQHTTAGALPQALGAAAAAALPHGAPPAAAATAAAHVGVPLLQPDAAAEVTAVASEAAAPVQPQTLASRHCDADEASAAATRVAVGVNSLTS